MSAIEQACTAVGGQSHLAQRLGVSPQAVSKWIVKARAPAQRCLEIEVATGGAVSRYALRPDVYGAAPAATPEAR